MSRRTRKPWTPAQDAIVRRDYPRWRIPLSKIAKRTGHSAHQVENRAQKLRVRRPRVCVEYYTNQVTFRCEHCGKLRSLRASAFTRGGKKPSQRFCSRQCAGLGTRSKFGNGYITKEGYRVFSTVANRTCERTSFSNGAKARS